MPDDKHGRLRRRGGLEGIQHDEPTAPDEDALDEDALAEDLDNCEGAAREAWAFAWTLCELLRRPHSADGQEAMRTIAESSLAKGVEVQRCVRAARRSAGLLK